MPAEAASYLVATNRINFVRDYGGEVGGPVWRDHLWFWAAMSENKISNQAASSPASAGALDNIILRDKNAKLNGQILPSNSGVFFYSFGDKVRNARSLSPTRPFETAYHQTGPTKVYKVEDTQIVGTSLYLTGMWSKVDGGFSLIPNGGDGEGAATAFRDTSNVWHNTFRDYITTRPQKQYRLDGSKFFDIGTMNHELKFGFGYRNTPTVSHSAWPGPYHGYVRYRSSSYCSSRGVPTTPQCTQFHFLRDDNVNYAQKYNDFYVGDTILMGNLTIQAGLRWDDQKTKNTASSSPANPVIGTPVQLTNGSISLPGLSFGGDTRDLRWKTLEPRVGLTYALGSDKKTLLRAGYNRYANQIG
ncbi:MAG: hypothetical protein DMF59_20370, partial [Acidobacteria bacterium]